MTIAPLPFFDGSLPWAGPGSGCVKCGSNFDNVGIETVGFHGVDLGAEIEMEGGLALCYSCAVQVGLSAGMLSSSVFNERVAEIQAIYEEGIEAAETAKADAAQARLDKDTVERLLGVLFIPSLEDERESVSA